MAELAGEFPDREREIKAAVRSLTKKLVRARIVERGRAHRRPRHGRHPAALGRGRPLPHGPRLGPLPAGRDPGAQRHHPRHAPDGPAARHHQPRRVQALHAPLQLPAVLHRRDRLHARPQAPGDRPRAPGRASAAAGGAAARRSSPTRCGSSPTCWPPTGRPRWPRSAGRLCRSWRPACRSRRRWPASPWAWSTTAARYVTLTDILGTEDAFGDMDFKVAGTADAVTALQLDTKIDGLPADVLAQALLQAKDARLKILEVMHDAIAEPRTEVADQRPQDRLDGDPHRQDRRGDRAQGQGHQHPAAGDRCRHRRRRRRHGRHGDHRGQGRQRGGGGQAPDRRSSSTRPRPTSGAVYQGKVVNLTKFGAFVNVLPGRDGLLHISKLSPLAGGTRVNQVEDVLTLGQPIEVRVDDIDPQGKVSLSLANVPRTSGGDAVRDRGERPERSGGRAASVRARRRRTDPGAGGPPAVSFEDAFEAELVADLGDLGPGAAAAGNGEGRGGDAGGPAAARGAVDAPAGARPGIRTETLPCGIRLVTEAMADVRSVAVGFWVGTGSRDEPDRAGRRARTSSSTSCSRGRRRAVARPSPRASTRWAATATPSPPRSTRPSTSGCWPRTSRSASTSWATSCGSRPWPRADIDAERTVILDEILMHADEPADLVAERWTDALFPDHPLGTRHAGHRPERRGGSTTADIRALLRGALPAGQHGGVGGRRRRPRGGGRRPRGALRRTAGRRAARAASRRCGPPRRWSCCDGRPSRPTWCWACARSRASTRSAGRWPSSTTSSAGGLSSRLFQKVREQRGLAYSIWSERTSYLRHRIAVRRRRHRAAARRRGAAHRHRRARAAGRVGGERAGDGRGQGQPPGRPAAGGRGLRGPHEPAGRRPSSSTERC